MKSLVTGGAGFIGSNLVDKLLELGHEVVCIDNESATSNEKFYWNDKAQNHKLDIRDYENTRSLYDNVDYVFHVAAHSRIQIAIDNPVDAVSVNAVGTATVLQCSLEAKVKRVVYSSTSSAYGLNPIPNIETQPDNCLNVYSVSKTTGEKLCKVYSDIYGLETICLRYFNVYGNRHPLKGVYAPVIGLFIKQMKQGLPLTIVGDGEQRRDFTNVVDAVDANILAATQNIDNSFIGTIFNIGTGKNYSVNEVASFISENTIGIPARLGEARETLASIEKAKAILGYSPTIDLKSWINSQISVN